MKIYSQEQYVIEPFFSRTAGCEPLGVSHASIPAFQPVIATILRTGLYNAKGFLTTLTRQKMAFV